MFVGLGSAYLGEISAALVGPLLFPAFPESNVAENSTLVLRFVSFLVFGASGVGLCWRWTIGWAQRDEVQDQNIGLIAGKVRWLAIVTGLVAGVSASSGLGPFGAIVPGLLLTGAIAQARFQRFGFWLMLGSAVSLSSWMVPLGGLTIVHSFRMLHLYHDLTAILVTMLWAGSFLLLICCDRALIKEGSRLKFFQA